MVTVVTSRGVAAETTIPSTLFPVQGLEATLTALTDPTNASYPLIQLPALFAADYWHRSRREMEAGGRGRRKERGKETRGRKWKEEKMTRKRVRGSREQRI